MGKLWEYWKRDISSLARARPKASDFGISRFRSNFSTGYIIPRRGFKGSFLSAVLSAHALDYIIVPIYFFGGECPSIMSYWKAVFPEINLRLQLTLTPTPFLALLGIPDNEQHSHHSKLLISHLLYYAKKEILKILCTNLMWPHGRRW